jgi:uncharacterized small protein (DUF1192 family)
MSFRTRSLLWLLWTVAAIGALALAAPFVSATSGAPARAVDSAVPALQAQIEVLSEEVVRLKGQLAGKDTAIAALDAQIDVLHAELEATNAVAATLQGRAATPAN